MSQIHSQLVQLAEVLRNQPVRLYDSSILIAFDGHTAWQPFYLNQNSSSSPSSSLFSSNSSSSLQDHIPFLQSNVKLIDFTNGHFIISDQKQESGPDLDAIYGIETAAAMIETIRVQLVDCIRLAHQHAVALDVMKHQLRKCIKENVKC